MHGRMKVGSVSAKRGKGRCINPADGHWRRYQHQRSGLGFGGTMSDHGNEKEKDTKNENANENA